MSKHVAFINLLTVLFLGAGCTIRIIPGGGDGDGLGGRVYLDEAVASIVIVQQVGAATASVTATLTDSLGRTLTLASDQAVRVNSVDLVGPNLEGEFTATVDAADQYEIQVVEPSRGVEDTTADAPGEFQITSPGTDGSVSLSGFTLTWSDANNRLQARIRLSQTFEQTETHYFGPYTDTGSREFTVDDLEPFRHGGDLTLNIMVTKINTTSNVNGFKSGTASVRLYASRTAIPGP
jgi:hypothetical protein